MYPSRKIYLLPVCSMVLVWLFVSCVPPQNMVRRNKTAGYGEKNYQRSSSKEQHFSWNEDDSFFEEYNRDDSGKRERSKQRKAVPGNRYMRPTAYKDNSSTEVPRKRTVGTVKTGKPGKAATNKKVITHRVKKGDTLYSISRKYGTSVESLCAINNISNKNNLYVGTVLKVPSAGRSSKNTPGKSNSGKPRFSWPVSPVIKYMKDGGDGVKSIGVYIQSRGRAEVRSSASGVVEKTGNMRGFGNYVVIRHGNRYLTVYSNLDDVFVRKGQRLPAGKVLGRVDARDCRLHFQINHAGKAEDPLKYLKKG